MLRERKANRMYGYDYSAAVPRRDEKSFYTTKEYIENNPPGGEPLKWKEDKFHR